MGLRQGLRASRRVRRRRRERAERRTFVLGVAALVTTGAVIGIEIGRVWQRRSESGEDESVLAAAEETARETVEVVRAGYRGGSARENALLNLLVSFTLTFALTRASTHLIRTRGTFGPFRNVRLGRRHIHHFVPGIALAFLAGGASVVTRDEGLDVLLAIPFGAGVALTLDESALLLELEDVYWTEQGIVSVQITRAALLMLSALALAARVVRRGEEEVLGS